MHSTDRVMSELYQPLPSKKSIRLLTLLPGKRREIITCSLQVEELAEAPPFEALSYSWGPADPLVEIICNGRRTTVRPNLWAALRRLRNGKQLDASQAHQIAAEKDVQPRKLWVDQLCINQADLVERSQQVSFMRDIFKTASSVVCWLGDDDSYAHIAIPIIQEAARCYYHEAGFSENPPKWNRARLDLKSKESRILPLTGHRDWKAVEWFYKLEFFSRLWVAQEVAQKQDPIMIIGGYQMQWLDAVRGATFIVLSKYVEVLNSTSPLRSPLAIFGARTRQPLLDLLQITGSLLCSDPRDKIWAILGLSLEGIAANKFPLLQPNYEASVCECYSNVIRSLIQEPPDSKFHGGLDILAKHECLSLDGRTRSQILGPERRTFKSALHENDKFPSWIPRWDHNTIMRHQLSTSELVSLWKPSKGSKVRIGRSDSASSLVLRGVRIQEICFVDTRLQGLLQDESSDATKEMKALFDEIEKSSPAGYPTGDPLKRAFAASVTAGKNKNHLSQKTQLEAYQEADIEAWWSSVPGEDPNDAAGLFDALCKEYSFFMTAEGHMGTGSRDMRVGDQICVLFGGNVLHVVRKMEEEGAAKAGAGAGARGAGGGGDCYELVGECYVHGFMQGEAMELWRAGKAADEWFDFR